MKSDVLQCHVHNLPIRQSIEENFTLTFDFGLILVANASVLFHSFLSQSGLNRGQPTVGSGRKVRKNECRDESGKDRQSSVDKE